MDAGPRAPQRLTRAPARRRGACSARRPRAPIWARTPRRPRRRRAPRCRCCRRRAAADAPPVCRPARPARRSGPSARPSRAAAVAARRTRVVRPRHKRAPQQRAKRCWHGPRTHVGARPQRKAQPGAPHRARKRRAGRGLAVAGAWREPSYLNVLALSGITARAPQLLLVG